jgi:hypothetical protein
VAVHRQNSEIHLALVLWGRTLYTPPLNDMQQLFQTAPGLFLAGGYAISPRNSRGDESAVCAQSANREIGLPGVGIFNESAWRAPKRNLI